MDRSDVYNREKLYKEVWSQPVIRIAPSYGISGVALAKVCRKLQVPLPGRGYWAKQAHGHFVKCEPLPELSNVPVIIKRRTVENASPLTEEQKDPELIRIEQLEKLPSQSINPRQPDDQLVVKATTVLKAARTDDRHILRAPWK